MPELPDVEVYRERLVAFTLGRTLLHARLLSPFILRSVDPPIRAVEGRTVEDVRRIGKRIAIGLAGDIFLVIHLMIAGRLRWRPADRKIGGRIALAAFEFEHGTLWLTEAGTKRRATLHVVQGTAVLAEIDRGGIDVFECTLEEFSARIRTENHTIKRSLTDPRILSGIGNAYSDEILHRARMSPLTLTHKMSDEQVAALLTACRTVLTEWTERLRAEAGDGFPEQVTAFRPEMAVHGRFGQPCPVCDAPVQRIRYAANETNYCARCQTGGRVLADRAMSRLLRDDWPRSIDELD